MAEKKENYIKICGELVAVTEEVYYTYYHMGRQRMTQLEKEARRRVSSYDALDTDEHLGIDLLVDEESPGVEEAAIAQVLSEKLHRCLEQLPKAERDLILALFFEGQSEHQLAKKTGVARMTLHDRKVRALCHLKKLMEK